MELDEEKAIAILVDQKRPSFEDSEAIDMGNHAPDSLNNEEEE